MDRKSIPVWCELICDQCSRQLVGEWSSAPYIPREKLLSEAEKEGAVIKGGDIFCKACAPEATGGTQP